MPQYYIVGKLLLNVAALEPCSDFIPALSFIDPQSTSIHPGLQRLTFANHTSRVRDCYILPMLRVRPSAAGLLWSRCVVATNRQMEGVCLLSFSETQRVKSESDFTASRRPLLSHLGSPGSLALVWCAELQWHFNEMSAFEVCFSV